MIAHSRDTCLAYCTEESQTVCEASFCTSDDLADPVCVNVGGLSKHKPLKPKDLLELAAFFLELSNMAQSLQAMDARLRASVGLDELNKLATTRGTSTT